MVMWEWYELICGKHLEKWIIITSSTLSNSVVCCLVLASPRADHLSGVLLGGTVGPEIGRGKGRKLSQCTIMDESLPWHWRLKPVGKFPWGNRLRHTWKLCHPQCMGLAASFQWLRVASLILSQPWVESSLSREHSCGLKGPALGRRWKEFVVSNLSECWREKNVNTARQVSGRELGLLSFQ